MTSKSYEHPWGGFLRARARCLKWLRDEMGESPEKTVQTMQMEPGQIRSILDHVDASPDDFGLVSSNWTPVLKCTVCGVTGTTLNHLPTCRGSAVDVRVSSNAQSDDGMLLKLRWMRDTVGVDIERMFARALKEKDGRETGSAQACDASHDAQYRAYLAEAAPCASDAKCTCVLGKLAWCDVHSAESTDKASAVNLPNDSEGNET